MGFLSTHYVSKSNVVMDDDTTTPLHRSEDDSSVRDFADSGNHDSRSPLPKVDDVDIEDDNFGDSVY